MESETERIIQQGRRERERGQRLRRELRDTFAQSLVVLWHSRRHRAGGGTVPADLAGRAEQAKRNRESVVRTPRQARHTG